MPTAFCALEDVYSDWNFKKPEQIPVVLQPNNEQNHPSLKPLPRQQNVGPFQKDMEEQDDYIPNNYGLKSFCPNCNNCIRANDVLQQRIIEQNIWPRPRWTPQYPQAYVPFDPYNRYWMNNVPQNHTNGREDFGNIFENFGTKSSKLDTETLLQVILFILVALFVIQLVECLYMRATTE
jgi:hypothetical protein